MNDLLVNSIFAKWYEGLFIPPVSVRLSNAWGVSVDEIHTQLLSWAYFTIFILTLIILFLVRRQIYALWLSVCRLPKGVIFASAIVIGSLAPDIDHFIKADFQYVYGKGWGHSILGGLLVLAVLSVAYTLRHRKARVLK